MLLALAALAALFVGRYPSPGFLRLDVLRDDPIARRLVLELRLPRVVAGALIGASLAGAGTVFQMLFSNPLVEPGFLGVSQGAAFGAALAIVVAPRAGSPASGVAGSTAIGAALVEASALLFALAGLALSYALARLLRFGGWVLRLVLAGIAVSALFSAGTGAMKLAADPLNRLPAITFWLLGGLSAVGWRDVLLLLPAAAAGLGTVLLLRWRLDVLSLDDRVAHALGGAPDRERLLLLCAATLATAASVSVGGLVGWVGLLAPHAARRLVGSASRRALPASLLLGAAVVLVCDALARTMLAAELPLGILTAVVGAGAFLGLMTVRPSGHGRDG